MACAAISPKDGPILCIQRTFQCWFWQGFTIQPWSGRPGFSDGISCWSRSFCHEFTDSQCLQALPNSSALKDIMVILYIIRLISAGVEWITSIYTQMRDSLTQCELLKNLKFLMLMPVFVCRDVRERDASWPRVKRNKHVLSHFHFALSIMSLAQSQRRSMWFSGFASRKLWVAYSRNGGACDDRFYGFASRRLRSFWVDVWLALR